MNTYKAYMNRIKLYVLRERRSDYSSSKTNFAYRGKKTALFFLQKKMKEMKKNS